MKENKNLREEQKKVVEEVATDVEVEEIASKVEAEEASKREILETPNRKPLIVAGVIILAIIAIVLAIFFGLKGKEEKKPVTPAETTIEQVEVTEEVTSEVSTTEATTETIVEETETVEEKPEMIDWETWATSTDTEDVRLAVWNETTGTQMLLENGSKYEVQEGDRFSIANREIIKFVNTSVGEIFITETPSGSYYEIPEDARIIDVRVDDEQVNNYYQFVIIK